MMLYAENDNTSPAYNLAFEEYICGLKIDAFMLWRNSPSVIIGRFQDVESEVFTDFAWDNGIHIVRRNSGGGAVYHDLGNVNYSFVLEDDRRLTLGHFSRIIMGILSGMGVKGLDFRHNDILAGGLKISGGAQYHHDGRILHHGTLLFDSNLDVIPKVLRRCGQVTNIKPLLRDNISVNDFMTAIRKGMGISDKLTLTQNDYDNVNEIMRKKYLSPQWNAGKLPGIL